MFKEITTIFHHKTRPPTASFTIPPVWEIAVHLAVACGVYGGVFLCCLFFPRDVLNEILNLIESVSEGFPSYSHYMFYRNKGYFQLSEKRTKKLWTKNTKYM